MSLEVATEISGGLIYMGISIGTGIAIAGYCIGCILAGDKVNVQLRQNEHADLFELTDE